MIDIDKVKSFFDSIAEQWDDGMIIDDGIVGLIMENAGIKKGSRVLDVACGTGVLVPYYLERGVSEVTAIDLSPEMIRIAKDKFDGYNIEFICDDAAIHNFEKTYDNAVIYNAFPHFADPEKLIINLSSCLEPGGKLTIAHGMSRERINSHHGSIDNSLFVDLLSIDELSVMVGKHLRITTAVSNEKMYQIVAEKKLKFSRFIKKYKNIYCTLRAFMIK